VVSAEGVVCYLGYAVGGDLDLWSCPRVLCNIIFCAYTIPEVVAADVCYCRLAFLSVEFSLRFKCFWVVQFGGLRILMCRSALVGVEWPCLHACLALSSS